jgi:hypothetical protein
MAIQQSKNSGEDEVAKKKRLQQEAIDKARKSGTSSNKTDSDTSASANIYYRGYDKSGKEVRVKSEDMPQSNDDKTKLAWQKGVTSFTKVTEANASTKKTETPTNRDYPLSPTPEPSKKQNFVGGGYNWADELKNERFKFKK